MDILVRERGERRDDPTRPGEARVWGMVAVAVVFGLLLIITAFDRGDRTPVASNALVLVQKAPVPLMPERVLP
jgi:hypothetical protein